MSQSTRSVIVNADESASIGLVVVDNVHIGELVLE